MYRVTKRFRDKNDKKRLFEVGDLLEVYNPERAADLLGRGLVVLTEEPGEAVDLDKKPAAKAPPKPKPPARKPTAKKQTR